MANAVQDIIDIGQDGDVCSQDELKKLYRNPYQCTARKAVGLDNLFILHMDCQWKTNTLAAALSNNAIHLTQCDTLVKISTVLAHQSNIIGLHFNPVDSNSLLSGSSDGTIKVWDLRNPQKHAQEFRDDEQGKKLFMTFDINCEGKLICAGTEKTKFDSYLLFWDVRSNRMVKSYSEFHDDDISHVQFHFTSPNQLASGSTDKLINVYDLSIEEEDDALQFSMNTETMCERIQWLGQSAPDKQNNISVITQTKEVQNWDIEEAVPKCIFTREKIIAALRRKVVETSYVVRTFYTHEKNETFLLAGSHSDDGGCLRLLSVKDDMLEPYAILHDTKGKCSQLVRDAVLNEANGQLVTGGEDGIINVWMPSDGQPTAINNQTNKVPTKAAFRNRGGHQGSKPYGKRKDKRNPY